MSGPPSLLEACAIWNIYRGKVVAEDALINHRMSWMLWAEAILYAMWGVIALPDREKAFNPVLVHSTMSALSFVGLLVCIWTNRSISAAIREVNMVIKDYRDNHSNICSQYKLPGIISEQDIHWLGYTIVKTLPTCFGILQLATLIYSVVSYFLVISPIAHPAIPPHR